jgi:hypothetical protein
MARSAIPRFGFLSVCVLTTLMPHGYCAVEGDAADATKVATSDKEREQSQDQLRRRDSVSVRATPDLTGPGPNGEFVLDRADMRNLGTVLADDPLRAVQALPGVNSNNDFEARFSLRGAGFDRIGIYLDGILLHSPVHGLEGTDLSGSAGIFQASSIREMRLYGDAYPEKFADSSAAALDVSLRDGDSDRYHVRMNGNLAGSSLEIDGPLGKACTSIGGFRKTYIQYLLAKTLTDPSMAFGIQDAQGRLNCRVSSSSSVFLDLIDSHTDLDRRTIAEQLGDNALMRAAQRTRILNAGWVFNPVERVGVTTHVAWMNDSFNDQNPSNAPLGDGSWHEWTANSNLLWMWSADHPLEAGISIRLRSAAGFTQNYDTVQNFDQVDAYRGSDLMSGGYLGQGWTFWKDRVHISGSGRWDHDSRNGATTFAPQAGASFRAAQSLEFTLGIGEYRQMPDITQLASALGGTRLRPMRSTHANAGLEYRLGSNTRLRLAAWERRDGDLLFQPFFEPRLIAGTVFFPPGAPLYENSLSGRGRGYEIYLQRNLSKHVSGWISYANGRTIMHDSVTDQSFAADQDQRHSVNGNVNYAFSRTLDVSSRLTYGSGMPVPGFLTTINGEYYLASQRNSARLPPYLRLDFRVNKTWRHGNWNTRLFAEVLNATNRANVRFGSLDWYSPVNGRAEVTTDTMFPILPNAGIEIER